MARAYRLALQSQTNFRAPNATSTCVGSLKVSLRKEDIAMAPAGSETTGPSVSIFDMPRQVEQEVQATGSGVIVDAQRGYVLTNSHMVEHASQVEVTTKDKRRFTARIIGRDPDTDIAILQRQGASGLTALPFADSDRVQVGDFVLAIGNPFGLGQTVTSGIVSALGRSGLGTDGYEDFIQTDAP